MEVQQVQYTAHEQSASKAQRSLYKRMSLGFLAGLVGTLAIFACYRAGQSYAEPSLSLSLARPTTGAFTVSPHLTPSIRADAWTVDAKLRKRDRQGEKRRIYNKAIKSAVRTRTKKALRSIEAATKSGISAEADLADSDKLMSEAYKQIDKAVSKGIMKQNTGARQKSRIATWRKKLLISSGLYTPAEAPATA
jgi:small subunit ribosomal protein S20